MTVYQLEELKALWFAFFPGTGLWGITSEPWKEMGWQGTDPSTDFRWRLHLLGKFVILRHDLSEVNYRQEPTTASSINSSICIPYFC
ncbi:hypothetical protein CFC21_059379 [Triticum aestivum]|uniref:ELMO domain-containing protein n=2 Tax=Triticum aestivum TaxID=4565 RepID=A0A9R1KEH6_WHEAT|nr:hypothetical protein CFC21_059379 [Triticum aestivum]